MSGLYHSDEDENVCSDDDDDDDNVGCVFNQNSGSRVYSDLPLQHSISQPSVIKMSEQHPLQHQTYMYDTPPRQSSQFTTPSNVYSQSFSAN